MREFFFLAMANYLPRLGLFDRFRYLFLKAAGVKILGKCTIWGDLTIRPIGGAQNIEIGEGTFINTGVRFGVPGATVTIGENVQIGPRVMFETASHGLEYIAGKGRGTSTRPIVVEDEVWIGGGAIICQGVTIGRGSVVAAGAVVVEDVASHIVVGGVPAKTIRKVSESH
ncbi:MAG: DapH/DapD/GlmU-related protein [Halioglobus sp.]